MAANGNVNIAFAILTVSDRCFAHEAENKSGPALRSQIEGELSALNAKVVWSDVVADDKIMIKNAVEQCCDVLNVDVLLTTGGTGLAPRDVTPDAIQPLLDREVPGLTSVLLLNGLTKTPFSALSRAVVGVRKKTLIATLPGSRAGAVEGLQALAPVLSHAVDLIRDDKPRVSATHSKMAPSVTNHQVKSKVSVDTNEATRKRSSEYAMVDMAEVPDIIMKNISGLAAETEPSEAALGRILAEDAVSHEAIPQVRTSMKDGYAVVKDRPVVQIVGESKPGYIYSNAVNDGEAIKVSTGSQVPDECEFVIPVEETSYLSEDKITIVSPETRARGCDVRVPGSDVQVGQVVVPSGALLSPPELGSLAAVGISRVSAIRKPVVALLSTGDELQNPWNKLRPGGVRDSNKIVLRSLIESWGHRVVDLGIATDEADDVLRLLKLGFDQADVVITTGGMSMGERDLLKQVLITDLGATIHFGRLSMKPGKPTGFGSVEYSGQKKLWFGLPGNPASAFVTAYLIVLPALRILSGWTSNLFLTKAHALLEVDIKRDRERVEFQRGVLTFVAVDGSMVARVTTTGAAAQRSSSIHGCTRANCLVEVPSGDGLIKAGERVTVHLLKF